MDNNRLLGMSTNEFLEATYDICICRESMIPEEESAIVRPKIICDDGFQFSLQASNNHRCSPRKTFKGPYNSVELCISYPSKHDALLNDYTNGTDRDIIYYDYVPVSVVDELIQKHRGINGIKIPWSGKKSLENAIKFQCVNLK